MARETEGKAATTGLRKFYIYCGVVLCLITACFVFLMVQPKYFPLEDLPFPNISEATSPVSQITEPKTPPKPTDPVAPPSESEDPLAEPYEPTAQGTEPAEDPPQETQPPEADIPTTGPPTEPEPTEPYICPDQLVKAMQKNEDVYAWITVPGTNIDYPIAQSPTNDAYYLKHDINKNYLSTGMLMTEHSYNTTTFEDPVTVVYGHCMKSDAMFGKMQAFYSSADGLEKYGTVEIYLSDKKLEYEVFAAVPYDTRHILYNYDFSDRRIYSAFFKSILSVRAFNASVNAEGKPRYGEKVLILSTCLKGDSSKRYLVLAKLK